MGEEHLNFLTQMSRLFEGRRAGECSSKVARILVEVAWNLAMRRIGAAARLQGACLTIGLARAIEPRPILGDARSRHSEAPTKLHQELALRAGVVIALRIEDKVGSRERAIRPVRLVEHWDVRLNLPLLNQPSQVRSRSIGAVRAEPLGFEPEALSDPIDHGRDAPPSACLMARLASTSRIIALSVSIR